MAAGLRLSKRITKTVKRKVLIKLPWLLNKKAQKSETKAAYEELPVAHSHQEEIDENALNEALEARLMEAIAAAPAQDAPITLQLGVVDAESHCFVPAFDLPRFQTNCQGAEAQQQY